MATVRDAEPEPKPDPDPSEHSVGSRSRSRLIKFRLRLRKRGKFIKKKTQNVKRKNAESIIFTAQFLPLSRTGEPE